MNKKGVPIPLARDPKTGKGSLTFTMSVVSFGVCIVLLAGKVTNILGDVDYDNALWLLGLTLSTYLGRQYQKNGKEMNLGISGSTSKNVEEPSDAGTSK
jgi:hypothetical protein